MAVLSTAKRNTHTHTHTHTLSHLQDVGDDSYAPVGETEREEREPEGR